MNKLIKYLSAVTMIALPAYMSAATSVTYNYQFAENSVLSTGKWVKIYTPKTGIYELTYDQLQAMGFSDPHSVSVFGNGGVMYPVNFTDYKGTRQFEDNPTQVAVMYGDDKLYFYGRGPEDITFNGKKFTRTSLNIYTNEGVYFLTDSATLLSIQSSETGPSDSATLRTDLYDYYYHEIDKIHNFYNTGQLFWELDLNESPRNEWNISLPYARTDSYNPLDMVFVANTDGVGSIHYGFGTSYRSVSLKRQQANTYLASNPDCKVTSDRTAQVVIEGVDLNNDLAGIDYWIYSYKKNLPAEMSEDFVQERLVVPASTAEGCSSVTVPEGSMVWDVTTASAPVQVAVKGNLAYVPNDGAIHTLMVVDPSKEQYVTDGRYSKITNQNLHAAAVEGANLLIICTDKMKYWAEKIAEEHREKDGLKVVVTTANELYDEFTSGIVDPMAYRCMAKMLYQAPTQLKNVLFMGPVYSDMRNVTDRANRQDGLIGYQEPGVLLSRSAANAMDYFGMAADYISNIYDLSQMPVEMGIGLLPCYSSEDGSTAYNKVRDYLDAENTDWIVNETLSISCPGDTHGHDYQSTGCATYVNNMTTQTTGTKFPHDTHVIDLNGYEKSREMFIDAINGGKLMTFYFGHASYTMLTQSTRYINGGNLQSLDNKNLGFAFFAGCELSGTDVNIPGIGEVCVTRAPRAFAGSIMSTRVVWSNYNYDLAMAFLRSLFYKDTTTKRTESATIGEAFAGAKTSTSKANDLNYLLIGDPALRVPVALRSMDVEVTNGTTPLSGGELLSIKGKVKNPDGSHDTNFNGKVSLKLVAPFDSVVYFADPKTVTKEIDGESVTVQDTAIYRTMINADRLSSVRADVKNGEFSAKLNVPTKLAKYIKSAAAEQRIPLYVGAYDGDRHLGASGYYEFGAAVSEDDKETSYEKDTEAPTVEYEYDPYVQVLKFTVTDNSAVSTGIGAGSALKMSIDGVECTMSQSNEYNCPVPSYTVIYPVCDYADGVHTVQYSATDEAGNSVAGDPKVFNKTTATAFALKAVDTVGVDNIDFTISGKTEGDLTMIVLDKKGNTVYSGEVSGSKASWNCSKAAAGIYRVAVRENSQRGSAIFSNWTTVSVID